MPSATQRVLAVAGLLSLAAGTTACSTSDSQPEQSESTTAARLAGCDGRQAPAYTGPTNAYDSVARVDTGKAVGVQVGQPGLTKASSGARGWSVATVDVRASVLTNGIYAVSPDSVILVDARGRECTRPRTAGAPSPLPVSEIDEQKAAAGTVSFLVPDDADLSTYSVLYAGDAASQKVEARWSAKGAAPSGTTAEACVGGPSPMSLRNVARTAYGKQASVIDPSGSGFRITASKPVARPLKPSDKHPNDVDGLAVNLTVHAVGTGAYLDRGLFQLIDGRNNLCRYGQLGTEGETLSSELIPAGARRTYTLIFWAPKGSGDLKGLQLLFRPLRGTLVGSAGWYDPKENPPYPKAAPKPTPSTKPAAPSTKPAPSTRPPAPKSTANPSTPPPRSG